MKLLGDCILRIQLHRCLALRKPVSEAYPKRKYGRMPKFGLIALATIKDCVYDVKILFKTPNDSLQEFDEPCRYFSFSCRQKTIQYSLVKFVQETNPVDHPVRCKA
jgi:hypothetical protein